MSMESSADLFKKPEGEYQPASPFDLNHMKDPLCCIRQNALEASAMVERVVGKETSVEKVEDNLRAADRRQSSSDVEVAADELDLGYLEEANQNQEEYFGLRNNSETLVKLEALNIDNFPVEIGGDS
ncbi:hypothetical protein Ancab_029531 [Ancistrocladus abbreviatus]